MKLSLSLVISHPQLYLSINTCCVNGKKERSSAGPLLYAARAAAIVECVDVLRLRLAQPERAAIGGCRIDQRIVVETRSGCSDSIDVIDRFDFSN